MYYEKIKVESLEIKDVIDINVLQSFQDNFAESMGIASLTVDRKGNPVTKPSNYTSFCSNFIRPSAIGRKRCMQCDIRGGQIAAKTGKPCIYTCHAGLIDFAAPILIDGHQIGTILGGQVLIKKGEESSYKKLAEEIKADEEKLIDSVKSIKILSEKKVRAAAELLYMFANYLSKIGYEGLKLKKSSKLLKGEISRTNMMLEESKMVNESMIQNLSITAHELKTPLNTIFSSVQLLERNYNENTELLDKIAFPKYSAIMKHNCYRLTRLINNIDDINKIKLGFFKLDLSNVNIINVIENITMSVIRYSDAKNISVVFDTDVEEKIISCDLEKIERIMLNLLSNAIKYTNDDGQINVNIYDKNDYILISVKDNGIGIPENMLQKIFDDFTQVDYSFRRKAEGRGMGLSIVKSLVELHNGEINVNSRIGMGSEFIIKLPAVYNQFEDSTDDKGKALNEFNETVKIELSDI